MKLSWQWIHEFLPDGVRIDARAMAQTLTDQGLEVESLSEVGALDPRIVVAKVLEKRPHPNADRLSLCRVSTGNGEFSVVCGAANVTLDHCYAFAQLGATLPGAMEIKIIRAATIRGEASQGMLCSEKELALPEHESGLLTLPAECRLGQPVRELPGIHDYCLDINVTPNRGDCLSHLGIARELYARNPEWQRDRLEAWQVKAMGNVDWRPKGVRLAHHAARLYVGRALGVVPEPSPFWVSRRLLVCGLRPVNTIVDATNYVLLELGHPVHAFDLAKLDGDEIVVRAAHHETIQTLDGRNHRLSEDDWVIADARGPVAIAGVMGGAASQVSATTETLFLECAVFDPASVRLTAKRLGIATESSMRFERGVDGSCAREVMERLTFLIASWSTSPLHIGQIVQQGSAVDPRPPIPLDCDRLNQFLGKSLVCHEVKTRLCALGFRVTEFTHGFGFDVTPPLYRQDVEGFADLAEEIVRIIGYSTIPSAIPLISVRRMASESGNSVHTALRDLLLARGFYQTIHFGFSPREAEGAVTIQNPLSGRDACLRQTIVSQLLYTYARDERACDRDWRLFEIGTVFQAPFSETQHLALLWTGVDFFDLKGLVDVILGALRVPMESTTLDDRPSGQWQSLLHPGERATLRLNGAEVLWLGQVHPEKAKALKLRRPPFIAEFDLAALQSFYFRDRVFKPFSIFPKTSRDLTVIVPEETRYGEMSAFLHNEREQEPWLDTIEFVAVYRGDPLPAGKKSLSVRLHYSSHERTLTDDEVNDRYFQLVEKIKRAKNVEIR